MLMNICILAIEKPLLTVHTRPINLIKMLSPQFIYLVLVGFILTNPIFSTAYFLK